MAAAPLPYARHGGGAVRPYLYGDASGIDFISEVFGAEMVEKLASGPSGFHVEARIGDSVLVLETSEAWSRPCRCRTSMSTSPTSTRPTPGRWRRGRPRFRRRRTSRIRSAPAA